MDLFLLTFDVISILRRSAGCKRIEEHVSHLTHPLTSGRTRLYSMRDSGNFEHTL